MKKTLLLIFALVVASMLTAQDEAHRYEVKSGILHEFTDLNGHITPAVRYFDNFGDVEAMVQTIDMGALGSYDNTTVTKKEKAWMYNESGKPKSFDNPTYDLTFVNPSQGVIDKYKIVDTGEDEVILGRVCRKFTYETLMGRRNKVVYNTVWVYKGITLKGIMKSGRQETLWEVTEFEENVEVPEEKFAIPE
ncbi:MAG: hypothetical protein IKT08_09025 [Bacteroidales bacterium]|nr:hypothetical protein [Bacteroidales bacterium]